MGGGPNAPYHRDIKHRPSFQTFPSPLNKNNYYLWFLLSHGVRLFVYRFVSLDYLTVSVRISAPRRSDWPLPWVCVHFTQNWSRVGQGWLIVYSAVWQSVDSWLAPPPPGCSRNRMMRLAPESTTSSPRLPVSLLQQGGGGNLPLERWIRF